MRRWGEGPFILLSVFPATRIFCQEIILGRECSSTHPSPSFSKFRFEDFLFFPGTPWVLILHFAAYTERWRSCPGGRIQEGDGGHQSEQPCSLVRIQNRQLHSFVGLLRGKASSSQQPDNTLSTWSRTQNAWHYIMNDHLVSEMCKLSEAIHCFGLMKCYGAACFEKGGQTE
jgi:hypothetical protein